MDTIVKHASTVVSLALITVVGVTSAQVFWPQSAGGEPDAPTPAYRTGEVIDTPAAWYEETPATLVLFAQATCGACRRAEPYLRSLVEHLDGRAAVVLASPGSLWEADVQFGRSLGLPEHAVRRVQPGTRVKVTPTLALIDQHGTILGAWEGVGPKERYGDLTAEIDALINSL